VESDAVGHPGTVVVEFEYAAFAHGAVVRAVRLQTRAELAVTFLLSQESFDQLLGPQVPLVAELILVFVDLLGDNFVFLTFDFAILFHILVLEDKEVISGHASCIDTVGFVEADADHNEEKGVDCHESVSDEHFGV